MTTYVLRRLLSAVPVLIGVSILVFAMLHLAPGDPARLIAGEEAEAEVLEQWRERLGLNDPLPTQYWRFVSGAIRGDLGQSLRTNRAVVEEIGDRIGNTLRLAAVGMTLAILLGLGSGTVAAVFHRRAMDNVVMVGAMLGVSIPGFWFGLLLIFVFAVTLGWFPSSGASGLRHLVLPGIALGVRAAAILARMTRSSMLEVIRRDFVRTARAKGLNERTVIYRHVLKNSLIPVITIIGLQFGALLAGTIIIEQVFTWPGLGTLLLHSLNARDYPLVQGIVLYIAVGYIAVNLAVDLLYGYLDPRIRYD